MNPLYLGVSRKIITPEVGGRLYGYRPDIYSESIADDLTVDAFYFKQGDTVALLISATVCAVATDLCDELRQEIEARFRIPASACAISAIHTHSGPCLTGGSAGWGDRDVEYIEKIFRPQLLAAVADALENPVQVEMGVAKGDSLVGINRRELTLENKIVLGQNPWGPFNPRMTVFSFRSLTGETVANLIHYGCHATSAGHNHEVTRDWPGLMIDAVEEATGGITAFFNGPEGDVGPRVSNGKTIGNHTMDYVYEMGAVAAKDALNVLQQISDYTTPELRTACCVCSIPLRPRMSRQEAETMYEKYKDRTVNMTALMKATALKVLESYDRGEPEKESFSFGQTVIALGDRVLVGFPYELFSEIGMRIDRAFPQAEILPVVNTNGSYAYFVTQDAISRGGYEISQFLYRNVQAYCEDADFQLVKATVANLEPLLSKPQDTDFVDPAD